MTRFSAEKDTHSDLWSEICFLWYPWSSWIEKTIIILNVDLRKKALILNVLLHPRGSKYPKEFANSQMFFAKFLKKFKK